MSDKKISQLNNLETSADTDLIPVVDVVDIETKRQTKANFLKEVNAELDNKIETETDPVFTASEAANFAEGDKNKLDGIESNANNYTLENHDNTKHTENYITGISGEDVTTALGYTPENQANKAQNNGYASLDSGGKVPASQLPATTMNYLGSWNASTNTPTLVDGTGTAGDIYLTSVAGTQNLGSGNIDFAEGDWVVYSGTVWEKSINSNRVVSVNEQTGVVTLTTDHIDEGATNKYDKTVSLTEGDYISVTGTYPDFTIAATGLLDTATYDPAGGEKQVAFDGDVLNVDQETQQLIENKPLRYNENSTIADHPRDIPDKTYVDAAVTSLGINYYMRKADHDPAVTDPETGPDYKTLTPDPSEREAEEGFTERTAIADATNYVVQGWMGDGDLPKLVKGTYSVFIQVEKTTGRDVRFFGRLFKRNIDTNEETQIGEDSDFTEIVSANNVRENEFFKLTLSEDVIIAENERVVGKIYVRGAGGGSNATVRIYYCGDVNSYFALPTNKAVLDQMYAPNQHDNDNHTENYEDSANKVTEFQATPTDTAYPSEKLVKDSLDDKADTADLSKVEINAQTDNYTLALADAGKLITVASETAKTLTIPKNDTVDFPTGTKIAIIQGGAGTVTIAGATDVVIKSFEDAYDLAGEDAGCLIIKTGANEWRLEGNLVA